MGSKEEPPFSQQDGSGEVREKVDSKEVEKLGWLFQAAAPEGGVGSKPRRGQDTVRWDTRTDEETGLDAHGEEFRQLGTPRKSSRKSSAASLATMAGPVEGMSCEFIEAL